MMQQRDGAVDVWWMPVDGAGTSRVERWRQLLDADERARADRFVFDRHRCSFIAAHALTRSVIGTYSGTPAADIRFGRTPDGRPFMRGGGDLDFSLTNTDAFVAVALCAGGRVGLDAEPAESGAAPSKEVRLAERYFAPTEASLVRLNGRESFIRLWTLKEAVLKATGAGVAGLADVRFSFDPIRLVDGSIGGDWRFAQFQPDGRHVMAVAHHGSGTGPADVMSRAVAWDDLCSG